MNNNPNSGSSRKEKRMNARTKATSVAMLATLCLALTARAAEPPKAEPKKQPTTSTMTTLSAGSKDLFQPLDLKRVKVGGEIGRRIDLTIEGNLLQINPDQHIKPFVTRNTRGAEPFIGTGKTLDGMVRLAAYSGKPALIARKKLFVETLLANQESDGYIGIMPKDVRTWQIYDVHDQAFVIQSLIADYQLFGEKPSLEGARKLADYLIARWPDKPAGWTERIPGNEDIAFIGLDMAFLMMHRATGDKRYLDFLNALTINHMKVPEWDREVVQGRHGRVFGHIYACLSHALVQLRLHRLDPNPKLLATTHRFMDFLLVKDGLTITGGTGHDECWSSDQRGTGNLGETCATAYQVFVYDDLMRMQGKAMWGDLIERTLYNAAFAAHSPDGRRIRYYTPFEGRRGYWGSDTYCCPGNFRRLMAVLPELVLYRTEGGGVVVNLYAASEGTIGEGGDAVSIRQKTDYPTSGKVVIHVDPAKSRTFPVLVRIPRWCETPAVAINGKPVAGPVTSGEFLRLERMWQAGDQVTLNLPMKVRFVAGRKAQEGRAAVMYGPVIFTLNPGANPELAGVKPASLVIRPDTAEIVPSDAVRPGGLVCRIKADADKPGAGAIALTLTEFPDPEGQAIYFQLADPKVAVADELMTVTK